MADSRFTIKQVANATAFMLHHGPHWLNAEIEREEWMAKVRACGFDADAMLDEARAMAAESIDATITTPRPAMTEREARAAVWHRAIYAPRPMPNA